LTTSNSESDYAASKAVFLKALEPLGVSVVSEGPPTYGVELSPKGKASLCLYQTEEKPAHLLKRPTICWCESGLPLPLHAACVTMHTVASRVARDNHASLARLPSWTGVVFLEGPLNTLMLPDCEPSLRRRQLLARRHFLKLDSSKRLRFRHRFLRLECRTCYREYSALTGCQAASTGMTAFRVAG
jgi:hypothetical protein